MLIVVALWLAGVLLVGLLVGAGLRRAGVAAEPSVAAGQRAMLPAPVELPTPTVTPVPGAASEAAETGPIGRPIAV